MAGYAFGSNPPYGLIFIHGTALSRSQPVSCRSSTFLSQSRSILK
jgi:hypothetical protein